MINNMMIGKGVPPKKDFEARLTIERYQSMYGYYVGYGSIDPNPLTNGYTIQACCYDSRGESMVLFGKGDKTLKSVVINGTEIRDGENNIGVNVYLENFLGTTVDVIFKFE